MALNGYVRKQMSRSVQNWYFVSVGGVIHYSNYFKLYFNNDINYDDIFRFIIQPHRMNVKMKNYRLHLLIPLVPLVKNQIYFFYANLYKLKTVQSPSAFDASNIQNIFLLYPNIVLIFIITFKSVQY